VLALEEQLGVKTEEKACRELALWKKKRDKKHDDFKADKKRDVLVLEANLKLTQVRDGAHSEQSVYALSSARVLW
jgi:hypothetical protein